MPKHEKIKVNIKERVDENVCDLSLSELSEVPVREIQTFKRVTTLDLSSNRLTSLGKTFITLTRLTKLDLSKNQIKVLPEEFGLLQNLRHLDLYDNKLDHLPLSFGNLTNLRYLDLKGNPLIPGLAKIVGFCLTTKECHDAARNTVKFLALMQTEAEKAKIQYQQQPQQSQQPSIETVESQPAAVLEAEKMAENQKKLNKKAKSKAKKSNTTNNNHNNPQHNTANNNNNINNNNNAAVKDAKTAKSNKTNKAKKSQIAAAKKSSKSSTALTSIFVFFILLTVNILLIYMIMFKKPEIADKLVAYIPLQYRDWILTKTEFFRLRVTDWISQLSTPPEEH